MSYKLGTLLSDYNINNHDYKITYLNKDYCENFTYLDHNDWPKLKLPCNYMDNRLVSMDIMGTVSYDGNLVAAWGNFEGVTEFFMMKSFQHKDDLTNLSEVLCTKIFEPMFSTIDGSGDGINRPPIMVEDNLLASAKLNEILASY